MSRPTTRSCFSVALAIGLACAPRPRVGEGPRVEEAVRRYIRALIRAYAELDFDPLRDAATRKEAERVETLARFQAMKHRLMEASMEEFRFDRVTVEEGRGRAEVRTHESWRWGLRDMRTGAPIGAEREERDALSYRLVVTGGVWRVDEVRPAQPSPPPSGFPLRKEPVPGEEP